MKIFSRRSFLAGLSALPLAAHYSTAFGEESKLMFAGAQTAQGSSSKGIYAYRWNQAAGTLESSGLAAETVNPTFLAVSPDRRYLYAVNEVDEYNGAKTGSVSAFSIDASSGKLMLKNVVSSAGAGPCNVAVDHSGEAVFAADYAGGALASFRVLKDGGLSNPVSAFHFTGHSVHPTRQAAAHTHCVTHSPDNRYLLVNDLGMDRIMVFHLQPATAVLTENTPAFYSALPGSGPRNLAFHPNGRWAYSINELGSTLDALAWDSSKGILMRFQNIATQPADFRGRNAPAQVVIEPAGRHLYASNRGADTIAVFAIDSASGKLRPIQQVSCGGKFPRHFVLDPSGRWLLAANQNSASIVVLARDTGDGRLHTTGKRYTIDRPNCLVFA